MNETLKLKLIEKCTRSEEGWNTLARLILAQGSERYKFLKTEVLKKLRIIANNCSDSDSCYQELCWRLDDALYENTFKSRKPKLGDERVKRNILIQNPDYLVIKRKVG